jgi:hypothetical protein
MAVRIHLESWGTFVGTHLETCGKNGIDCIPFKIRDFTASWKLSTPIRPAIEELPDVVEARKKSWHNQGSSVNPVDSVCVMRYKRNVLGCFTWGWNTLIKGRR